jgi:tetratricopeptide (TPR) repeat protein
MQKVLQKNIFIFSFFLIYLNGYCRNELIIRADSLLIKKKYVEAAAIYTRVLQQSEFPSVVYLKLAFIKEKTGNYEQALYFLNTYYLHNPSESILRKMESIAQQYNLKGYRFTDKDFFRVIYDEFYLYELIIIAFCNFLVFVSLLSRRKRKRFVPVRRNILFMIILLISLIFINIPRQNQYVIISHDNTYLRDAPSSGSNVKQITGKGHRLPFVRQTDVWIETEWNGEKVFIHSKNVLKVIREL